MLTDGGLTHFLVGEEHGHDHNVVIQTAVLDGVLSTKQNDVAFYREVSSTWIFQDYLTRDNYKNKAWVSEVAWMLAAYSMGTFRFNTWSEFAAIPSAQRYVKTLQNQRVTVTPYLVDDGSDATLDMAISATGMTILAGGAGHFEATPQSGLIQTRPGYWTRSYYGKFPWSPKRLELPKSILASGDSIQAKFSIFNRLYRQRRVALVRAPSTWTAMVSKGFDGPESLDSYGYYNSLGYAGLDIVDKGLNSTIFFPAEHMPSLKKRLKPGKKHVYYCNAACTDYLANMRDEL
jgi:hypothetical protein